MTAPPGGPQGSTSDEPTLPARVQRLLSHGDLARVDATPVDVAQIWRKALENAHDAELPDISLEGAIQSAYTAGFNAALCLLLAYGLKTRSGRGHHERTFSVAKELGGARLKDLVAESSEIRGLRAGSVYDPVLADEEDRALAIEWMRKTLPLIREALAEADQALAPRLPNYKP